ncbi:MAG TPA: ECF-type sigma factor [Pyrinomonadaceae bacterium]
MPTPYSDEEVLKLLQAWNKGDEAALEKLIPLVDRELRSLAHAFLRRNRPGHDLETTGLINEMFVNLIGRDPQIEWHSQRQFFAIAARIMRHILIDHARKEKRRGSAMETLLSEVTNLSEEKIEQILLLDEALKKLEGIDERKIRIVEMKYFAGLSLQETAHLLEISMVTVEREWRFAKTWLQREIGGLGTTASLYVPILTQKPQIAVEKSKMPAVVTGDAERKLAEAWSNRELVATLMSDNWAGLKLLMQLRVTPNLTNQKLIKALKTDADIVNPLILKLKEFGALKKQEAVFSLTNSGNMLLDNLEKAIGKDSTD